MSAMDDDPAISRRPASAACEAAGIRAARRRPGTRGPLPLALLAALALTALSVEVAGAAPAQLGGTSPAHSASAPGTGGAAPVAPTTPAAAPAPGAGTTPPAPGTPVTPSAGPASFAVGLRVLRFVDTSRTIHLPHGRSEPRTLVTYVRYPALGAPTATDVRGAAPARAGGPFPLVVFAHGFAVTPAIYARLLQSWARAGYVVAAPVFPLENANAPGGPDESDLANQPADVSFVISRMLAAARASAGPVTGLLDPAHIAVAGQSDGGMTALAAAYSRNLRDPRIGAAVVLSGAEMSGVGGFDFRRGGPPLLAAQGTADTINEPRFTNAFFKLARGPKYLLRLLGAGHLPPYTYEQPQLAIVERATIAFLDSYLKRIPGAVQRLLSLANVPRRSALVADP
jgi:dienelactone hydrolase